MDNKETFEQIGKSIKKNRIAENNLYIRSKAICLFAIARKRKKQKGGLTKGQQTRKLQETCSFM